MRVEEPKKYVNSKQGKNSKKTSKNESRASMNHDEDTNDSSVCDDDEASHIEYLFTAVMSATDDHNKSLHSAFQLLPSKKKYPEYYEVIEQPIDLKMIAMKIQNNKYSNVMELERDLMLMCKNACLFNEPGSQIYKNAKALKKVNHCTCD